MALFDIDTIPSNLLKDRFIIPPFTIFDTRQGYWHERKQQWLNIGIQSEVGRCEELLTNNSNKYTQEVIDMFSNSKSVFHPDTTQSVIAQKHTSRYGAKGDRKAMSKISIFDPVLCEITYKWFSRENDLILDPFSGGSVRGIIASTLNRQYTGIDLNPIQIDTNYMQYEDINKHYKNLIKPNWINGNSLNIKSLTKQKCNLIFSCPPYYNLEVYSNSPEDLSNKGTYEEFVQDYKTIIKNACDLLEDNSFAVFVVSNVRSSTGEYYNLVNDTINSFVESGLYYYNEGIIINEAGTLPMRTPIQFNATRKLGKQHQNYLVFYKGDMKQIKGKFGDIDEKYKKV